MRRRRLLASLSTAGLSGLAGCGGRLPFGPSDAATSTPTPSTTPTAEPEAEDAQWLAVKNTRAVSTYVTVVVEAVDGSDSFFDSADLFSGEQVRFRAAAAPDSEYEVILETADGERITSRWETARELDGLTAYLTDDGVDFWRSVRCRPGCAVSDAVEADDLPLIGDGTGRWYAPASLVLQNPTDSERPVETSVSLRGSTVLDAAYRLPARTELWVPISYRTGTYTVAVDSDDRSTETEWPVPAVPQRHVRLDESVAVGCGPATPQLAVSNNDSIEQELTVSLHRDDELQFSRRLTLDPEETVEFTPVMDSGPYEVRVERDGETFSTTWWACPPREVATLLVDAAGGVSLQQGGPQPG
ncbi:hypothetical protein SAMN04487949_1972 [Halogranum gelatinilyticum]|uniref:Ig-like domain-containing protein n=1 Tax=Halogranum gelatinilyticum TaxID=660521 RepID=A0A1G9TZ11_9EURY|nr:hypothetical protein [Halogranum gelatinilyticum]SDM52912.1 hypothetical protein SAMN04487949_1972 [Halogranum gelatinilyticum]